MTIDPGEARRTARALAAAVTAAGGDALRFQGVDLSGALEQQLFFALRDGRLPAGGARGIASGALELLRPVAAAALGLAAGRLPRPGDGPIVVLVREPTHYAVIAQIEGELQAAAGESLALVRVGRAASRAPSHAIAPRLADLVVPQLALAAVAHRRLVARAMHGCAAAWAETLGEPRAGELRSLARIEVARIATGAAALLSVVRRWRPSLLVAFDEIGTWARLLPAVGRVNGIPSLDLPHAEAADPVAIEGAAYDRMATYGPRASEVLRQAGIPAERIVEIGAPRFDPLVEMAATPAAPGGRRLVFAAQYVTGAMRQDVLEACYRAALAAAAAVHGEMVVVPHPAEEPGTAARLVAEVAGQPAVTVRLAASTDLHREVIGASILVTGWSNSVFEAAVAGVPAITVDPGGVSPVDFAADGLSLGAADEEEAARAATSLLDDATRRAAVERARAVATLRLGPLDGGASARAARLMLSLSRAEGRRSAA